MGGREHVRLLPPSVSAAPAHGCPVGCGLQPCMRSSRRVQVRLATSALCRTGCSFAVCYRSQALISQRREVVITTHYHHWLKLESDDTHDQGCPSFLTDGCAGRPCAVRTTGAVRGRSYRPVPADPLGKRKGRERLLRLASCSSASARFVVAPRTILPCVRARASATSKCVRRTVKRPL